MIRIPSTKSDALERLLTWKASAILSLYMPVQTAGADKRENVSRFHNLLGDVKAMLGEEGWTPERIEAYLEPLRTTFGPEFWERAGSPGFACFYEGPDHEPVYWFLAEEVDAITTLHSRAHLKPLLDCWTRDRPYTLLCLTHDRLTLYRGTAFELEEVEDEDIPSTAGEVLGEENEIKSVQFHTETPSSAQGDRAAVFHGQGGPDNVKDERMQRFFQAVAGPITSRLERESLPLVLCGLPEVLSLYRGIQTYSQVQESQIETHPDSLGTDDLRDEASGRIREYFSGVPDEAVNRYKELVKELRVADSVDTVLPLAATGRVEHLFVARNHEVWGRFNPENLLVEHRESQTFGSEDLLDTCARKVYEYGGEIHLISDEEVAHHTGSRHVAAILRKSS